MDNEPAAELFLWVIQSPSGDSKKQELAQAFDKGPGTVLHGVQGAPEATGL